jgi:hypothetical protein
MKIGTDETTILSVVLYGYETFSLISRAERLRVLQNRELRRTFGLKRD